MSEARSLTALSENDYETISEAVMETARGRWFMAEFAKRNRQADTAQLLGAIGRIERAVGVAAAEPAPDPSLREAAALIADLRVDLERISGRTEAASSGLAQRIETSSARILAATETIQEASWRLREAGETDELCDLLDRRTTEIFAAAAIVEGTAQQIDKIADTIAMLDSSLRAFSDRAQDEPDTQEMEIVTWSDPVCEMPAPKYETPAPMPTAAYEDIEIVEIGAPAADPAETVSLTMTPQYERRLGSIQNLSDDLVFEETAELGQVEIDLDFVESVAASAHAIESRPETAILETAAAMRSAAATTSESDLYALDAMPADRKLAYFA
jgi:hypothetical protein